jgi:uncharacterized protein
MQPYMLVITEVAPYLDGPAGVHGVLGQAATALSQLAALAGLEPRVVTDVRRQSPADLANAAVITLFTIGETPFDPGQRAAVSSAWKDGRSRVLAIHSSSDACYGWDDYGDIVGARFNGHPWTQEFEIEVVVRDHPATRGLTSPWRWHDEIYRFRSLLPDCRILLRVAEGQLSLDGVPQGTDAQPLPLAWCRSFGPAKTFYSALGHFPGAWETPTHLRYLEGALEWLLEGNG